MKAWHAVASYIFRYTLLPFPQPIPVVETRLIASLLLVRTYQNYHSNVAVETQNFASLQSGWVNY